MSFHWFYICYQWLSISTFRIGCLVFISVFINFKSVAQVSSDSSFYSIITEAITTANAELLSGIINSKVDIELPQQSGIYSKNQSRFILQDFFEKNKPESFHLMIKNKQNSSSYYVGKLHTADKHYRLCFLTKKVHNKLYIYQIRIEE